VFGGQIKKRKVGFMETSKTQIKMQARPAGMSWLIPALPVKDVLKAAKFYEKAFGFETGMTVPDFDGKIIHAELKYQGSTVVMLGLEGAFGGTCKSPASSQAKCPIGLYVYCYDVDALYRRAKQAGAEVTAEPTNMFWGDRVTRLNDLDGYRWMFATNVAEFDPTKVTKTAEMSA
jgi:PhnB protein